MADVAVRLGPPPPAESYLRIDAILEAAAGDRGRGDPSRATASWPSGRRSPEPSRTPGSSSSGRRRPSSRRSGDKLQARRLARSVGVEVVPGTLEPVRGRPPRRRWPAIVAEAERIGFPLLVKAAAGGGGRGMRRVASRRPTCRPRWRPARPRRLSAFGDGSVYLEREIRPARHIEVQLLGDATGAVVAIGERDCSLQRRHQKLVEEAPAPGPDRRPSGATSTTCAVRVATAGGLQNAATAEFLRAPDGAPSTSSRSTPGSRSSTASPSWSPASTSSASSSGWPPDEPLSAAALAAADRAAEPGRPRHRGPPLGRGPGPRLRARARPDPTLGHAGGPRGPGRHRRRGGRPGPARLRQPDRQGHGPRRRTGRPPSTGCGAPSTRPRSPASRRPCRSTGSSPGTPGSGRATCRSTGSPTSGTGRRSGRAMPRRRRRRRAPGGRRAGTDSGAAPDRPAPPAARRRPGRDGMGGRRPGRRRSIGGRDEPPARHGRRSPATVLADVDPARRGRDGTAARPGERPIVLPGTAPARGPWQHPGRGRRRRLAVRARGRGRRSGRPPGPGHRRAETAAAHHGPTDGSCHHPGTRRVGGGRRRAMPSRPASGSSRWRR